MENLNKSKFYTVSDAAELLKLSEMTIRRAYKNNKLTVIKTSESDQGAVRIKGQWLLDYINKHQIGNKTDELLRKDFKSLNDAAKFIQQSAPDYLKGSGSISFEINDNENGVTLVARQEDDK